MKIKLPEMNDIRISGRLTADAELKTKTEGGDKFLHGTVATNKSYKDSDGTWKQTTDFIPFTLWRSEIAEKLVARLKKGTPLLIEGALKSHNWEDKEGKKHSSLDVKVNNIQILQYNEAQSAGTDAAPETSEEEGI